MQEASKNKVLTMKSLENQMLTETRDVPLTVCLKSFVLALAGFYGFLALISQNVNSAELNESQLKELRKFDIYSKLRSRKINNFVPSDDVISTPIQKQHWAKGLMKEDNKGVLISIKKQIKQWEQTEEYARNWHLASTGMFDIADTDTKVDYLKRQGLRYLDKRITGEMKNAEKGTAMATVGQVHEALRPSTNVDIAPNIRMRFKARVLQGEASMNVENPYVESKTYVRVNGDITTELGKSFDKLGLRAQLNYRVDNGEYRALLNQRLSDHWSAEVISQQEDDKILFSKDTDQVYQLLYSAPFKF